jgi:hypothetical protein
MPLPNPRIPDPIGPRLFDPFLERLTHIALCINDPDPIRRVECHGEEDGVLPRQPSFFLDQVVRMVEARGQ